MLKHLLNYIPAKVVPGVVSLLSIYVFARIFTQDEYGNYSFVLAQLTLASAVFFSWMRLSSFRFFNIYKEQKKLFVDYIIRVYTLVFAFFVIIILIYLWLSDYEKDIKTLFVIGIAAILLTICYDQIATILRANLNSKLFAFYEVTKPIIKLATVVILVLILDFNESSIMYALIFSNLIVITHFIIKKKSSLLLYVCSNADYTKYDFTKINKEFLYYGLPLTLSFLFSNITSTSDRIIIKFLLDTESVAKYTLSYDLTTFTITNLFMILNFTFVPLIIRLVDSEEVDILKQKIMDYFNFILIIMIPAVIFFLVFAEEVTKFILGNQYNSIETVQIIRLISISAFIAGIKAYFFDFSFQFGKKTKNQIYPIVLGSIVNIILNFTLIPCYGLLGAIYASILSYIIALVSSIWLGQKVFKMNIDYKSSLKIILSYFLVTGIIIVVKVNGNNLESFLVNILIYVALVLGVLIFYRNKLKYILRTINIREEK